jgi:membrane-bound ClpP family serine protease
VLGLFAVVILSARQVVYVVPIAGMIDLGLAPFVQRFLDEVAACRR